MSDMYAFGMLMLIAVAKPQGLAALTHQQILQYVKTNPTITANQSRVLSSLLAVDPLARPSAADLLTDTFFSSGADDERHNYGAASKDRLRVARALLRAYLGRLVNVAGTRVTIRLTRGPEGSIPVHDALQQLERVADLRLSLFVKFEQVARTVSRTLARTHAQEHWWSILFTR